MPDLYVVSFIFFKLVPLLLSTFLVTNSLFLISRVLQSQKYKLSSTKREIIFNIIAILFTSLTLSLYYAISYFFGMIKFIELFFIMALLTIGIYTIKNFNDIFR